MRTAQIGSDLRLSFRLPCIVLLPSVTQRNARTVRDKVRPTEVWVRG